MGEPTDQPPGSPGPGWGPPPYGPPPYGPPPYGQPPYGQSGYGPALGYPYGPVGRQTEGTAIAVLVLAIAAFVFCPVIPAIVALAMAPGARRKIAESGGMKDGEGLVTAGVIIAWVHLAFAVLAIIALIVLVAAFSDESGSVNALLALL